PARVRGVEEHRDPARRPGGRLRGAGEERGDAARRTEHERDPEQPADRDEEEVGELITHRLAGAALRAGHDRPLTAIVPETRPTSTTSPAFAAATTWGSRRARARPSGAASV